MLCHQHRLFDHAVADTHQTQHALAADPDQIRLDTTAFASQVRGALTWLGQASSDVCEQLRQAWIANTNQVTTLRSELETVHRGREEAAEAHRCHQRAGNNQLQEEIRKLREDDAQ